jgi:carbonic anhydrase
MINSKMFGLLLIFLIQAIRSQTRTYNYINGGQDWPDASNSCGGKNQSPIVLDPSKAVRADDFVFEFEFASKGVNTTMTTSPHLAFKGGFSSVKFKDSNNTVLEFNGEVLHFHSPGEHFVNGRLYDAEMHMVHTIKEAYKNSTTFRYAVVAVLFEAKENEESQLLNKLDIKTKNSSRNVDLQRDFWDDFKKLNTAMHYQGSLTYVNCDETVYWFVFTTPLPMGIAQLTTMSQYFRANAEFANGRGNNRLIQKLNGRTVMMFNYQQKVVANLIESTFFSTYLQPLLS